MISLSISQTTPHMRGFKIAGVSANFATVATPGFTGTSEVLCSIDNQLRVSLSNFELSNANLAAIQLVNSPSGDIAGLIDDFSIHDSYIGFQALTTGEYFTIGRGTFKYNFFGVHLSGGNNKLVGTNFAHNKFGIMVNGGSNHGHGVIDGVTSNHNETSIYFNNVDIGQAVNGGAFFGGFAGGNAKMTFVNSKGILFNGTHIGAHDISIDATSAAFFRSVLWQGNVNITVAAGGVFDAKNCAVVPGATLTLNGVAFSGNN